MIRPIPHHPFLGAEPEISGVVLQGVPHSVGVQSIEAHQSGPDVAIVPRDTARSRNPQYSVRVLREANYSIVQHAVFGFPISRKPPLCQSAKTIRCPDPYNT